MFQTLKAKGLSRLLVDSSVDGFTIHLTRLDPGARSHEPHTHGGAEAFYILSGRALIEAGGERQELSSNEAIVLDAGKLHGISNAGTEELSYLVINAKAG